MYAPEWDKQWPSGKSGGCYYCNGSGHGAKDCPQMHQRVQERGVRVPSQRTPNWQLFCEVCWHRTKNDRRVINPGWGTCTEGTCWPCGTLYVIIIIIITTRSFTAKACARQANSVAHRLLRRKPRGVAFLDDVEEGSLRDLFAYTSACKEMGLGFRDWLLDIRAKPCPVRALRPMLQPGKPEKRARQRRWCSCPALHPKQNRKPELLNP